MKEAVKIMTAAESDHLDTIHPWQKVVGIRHDIKVSTVMRVWQLWTGAIKNLKAKPDTTAAEFVTPGGILTDKGKLLAEETEMERKEYLRQTNGKKN